MSHSDSIAHFDVRSPASRTLLTVLGTVVVVALLAGMVLGASILMRDTKVTTSVIDLGSSAQVEIDAGAADVRLVPGDPDVVKITARTTSGLRKTDFLIGRRGDSIKIVSGCQSWLSPGCGVTTTIAVPPGFPVVVKTTSGDVFADAISEGVLTVSTDSGDVGGTGLRLDEFSAQSASGSISASFAAQPFGIKATTDSGDVELRVPEGKRGYAVTTESDSGTVSSSIDSDSEGEGFIRATTGSGNILLGRP